MSHYGKRDIVYGYGSGRSTEWQFNQGLQGLSLGDLGTLPTIDITPSASNSSQSLATVDPVNWNPNLSTWVTEVNSILLPAEGKSFNESLSPYTTPFGVAGGDVITWVKNNLGLLSIGLIGLVLLPNILGQGYSRRR